MKPFTATHNLLGSEEVELSFYLFWILLFNISLLYCCSDATMLSWTTAVSNEFIVLYDAPLSSTARIKLLRTASESLYFTFSIQPHAHPFVDSGVTDFDVIRVHNVSESDSSKFQDRLRHFPGIKSVSVQRRIHRRILQEDYHSGNATNRNIHLFGKSNWNQLPGTIPLHPTKQPWRLLKADELWARGFCGQGVRVGIFDTGLVPPDSHPHFYSARVSERTDWTQYQLKSENSDEAVRKSPKLSPLKASDGHGHGTFVAGMLTASSPSWTTFMNPSNPLALKCPPPGLSPMVDLYIFRVFTDAQVSYTSWFLDAFNHAIKRRLHVINLSVGGPDFLDQPFVDKVWELSANGILLVSAIGNDGPLFGTLNNPGDQMDVLGVGGIDATGRIARFSSRGMTAWSLPFGYGQFKPDIVAYSTGVISSALDGTCRTLSGTSVASPVAAGIVALLINVALRHNQMQAKSHSQLVPINPASIKQVLIAGATPLDHLHVFGTEPIKWVDDVEPTGIFEQGAGLVDLMASYKLMQRVRPQASLFPSYLDLTQCPYMWPFCSQPLYYSMQPIVVNVTILNSMGVTGRIVELPTYHPYLDKNGDRLTVGFTYSERLWPWSGYLALHLEVAEHADLPSSQFSGLAEGYVTLTVESLDVMNGGTPLQTRLTLPLRVHIVPTPNRSRRILFDQFHSIRYPPGFIPRDDLTRENQQLDWLGDHIHTNMRDLYIHLRKANYFVEVLSSPYTCFDARNYGTLLIVDPEEEFFPAEIDKLVTDFRDSGLSVIVFADWYNTSVMDSLKFFDTNTRRLWTPETGGSNLPALNNLLEPFGVELGDVVYAGKIQIGRRLVHYTSGTSFRRFPNHNISRVPGIGSVIRSNLVDLGAQLLTKSDPNTKAKAKYRLIPTPEDPMPPVLGVWSPQNASSSTGRLAIHGDSDCLSSTHLDTECFWLLDALLQFVTSPRGRIPRPLIELMNPAAQDILDTHARRPVRPVDSWLYRSSNVVQPVPNIRPLPNGSLPASVYRPLPTCPQLPPGRVLPVRTSTGNKIIYEPQPLLLHPPVPDFTRAEFSACHMPRVSDLPRFTFGKLSHLLAVYLVLFLLATFLSRRLRPCVRQTVFLVYRLCAKQCRLLCDVLCWRRRRHAQERLYAELFQTDLDRRHFQLSSI